ncbi:MAG TPA: choice-of-anchor Q domain-containing protein, partial [Lacipirellula sp.]
TTNPGGAGGAGIEGDSYYGGTNIDLIGNVVHDIGPGNVNTVQGIYQNTSGTVANNVVYGASGWGIALWRDARNVDILNNTVFNNDSGGISVGGGDNYNSSGPADYVTVANNIVYDNSNYGIIEYGATGTHNVYTHNLVYQNGTNWRLQNGLTATETIAADPKFVNYRPDGGGDYRLAPDSPAIDAGIKTDVASDLEGRARPQGGGYDLGSYETSSSQTPTPSPAPEPSPTPEPIPTIEPFDLPVSGAWTKTISGGGRADTLNGTAGNDYLDGKRGSDTMIGGGGDDTYMVDARSGDRVIEHAGGGIDTVITAAAKFKLTDNVENLNLSGSSSHYASGNPLDNLITASTWGKDTIDGGAGNDILRAGRGGDTLTGGTGNDIFSFSSVGNGSKITDFHADEDLLDLRPLVKAGGYDGTDPVSDGVIELISDGSDGTIVMVDPAQSGTLQQLVTLQHVTPGTVHVGTDLIWV